MARLTNIQLYKNVRRMNERLRVAQKGPLKNIDGVQYVRSLKYQNLGFLTTTTKSGNIRLVTDFKKLNKRQMQALRKVVKVLETEKITTKTQLKKKIAKERYEEKSYSEAYEEKTDYDDLTSEELKEYGADTEDELLQIDEYLEAYEKARQEITEQAEKKAYYLDNHVSEVRQMYLDGQISEEEEKAIVASRLTRLYMQEERNAEGDIFDSDIRALFHRGL